MSSGNIRAGQNFSEANLVSENYGVSKVLGCIVHLVSRKKALGQGKGHPALSSPMNLWVECSKFSPHPVLDLERFLSNFLSIDLESFDSFPV